MQKKKQINATIARAFVLREALHKVVAQSSSRLKRRDTRAATVVEGFSECGGHPLRRTQFDSAHRRRFYSLLCSPIQSKYTEREMEERHAVVDATFSPSQLAALSGFTRLSLRQVLGARNRTPINCRMCNCFRQFACARFTPASRHQFLTLRPGLK
jgi:hypothetical protein